MKKLFGVGFLVLLIGFCFFSYKIYLASHSKGSNPLFIIKVFPGMGLQSVLIELKKNGAIEDLFYTRWAFRFMGHEKSIKVGEYEIAPNVSFENLISILTSGKSREIRVTFPEGYNIFEMATELQRVGLVTESEFIHKAFDKQLASQLLGEKVASLEGYLFPDTYQFLPGSSVEKIIEILVNNFKNQWNLLISNQNKKDKMTRHQLVTLASLVEKETGAPFERARIASVFYNRIEKKMRLQSDPTILYGLWLKTGQMPQNISKSQITEATDYNTYVIPSLPVGPIANPGREALKAVLNPEKTKFIFFVSKNQGTHQFSETYEEHVTAVRNFQLDEKMRKGKSWRDLSNEPSQ